MQLNSILFRAPKCSYTPDLLAGELIWIPKYENKQSGKKKQESINSAVEGDTQFVKEERKFNVNYSGQKIEWKKDKSTEFVSPQSFSKCLQPKSTAKKLIQCLEKSEIISEIAENIEDEDYLGSENITEDQESCDVFSMDECIHRNSTHTPLSLLNYRTKTFINPIKKLCTHIAANEQQQQLAVVEESSPTLPIPKAFPFPSSISRPYLTSCKGDARTTQPTTSLKQDTTYQFASKKDSIASEIVERHIPCLLLRPVVPSSKIIIHFHGNGEDLNMSYELLAHLTNHLNVNALAVEYPGYGLYQGTPDEETIKEDAETIYNFVVKTLNVKQKHIIVFGRSIGSGPAVHLASQHQIGALVLMSAFTSIRDVVKDLAGRWVKYLVKERFNNLRAMTKVTCPTFLIHGQKDKLVPFTHSEELHRLCTGASELLLPREMDHVEFDFYEDFTLPLMRFLQRCNIPIMKESEVGITFPTTLFRAPESVLRNLNEKERFLFEQNLDESIDFEPEACLDVN